MSLATSVLAGLRTLTQRVTLNGALIMPADPTSATGTPGVGAVHISKSFDSPAPTAEVTLNRIPTRYARGQAITIDLGYDGFTKRRFTGTLQSRTRRIGSATINCSGNLWKALRTIDSPEVDVTGMTIKQAIAARFAFCGVTSVTIDNSLDFTLGTAVDALLPAGPIADQIALLMDIRDAYAYELGSGQVIVRPIDFQPAPTASKSYSSEAQATARVVDGSDRDDPSYFRDQITVTGASIPNGDPDDPDTIFEPLQFTATLLGSGLQQPPAPEGAFSTAILSQPLIDTAEELVAYAQRKLTRFGRVPRWVTLELPGDPDIELGQTLGFNLPLLDVTGRWFVYGIEDVVDNAPESESNEVPGYSQFLTLRGGDEAGGTVAISPIATFTYAVVLQAVGDDLYAIITLDGTPSFDPDGEIVSWDWSGDVTGSGQVFTTAVLASSATELDVTLTVEDSDGLTDVFTETITIDSTGFYVTQPAIYCAADEWTFATPDGGQNFNDQEFAEATAVDAKPADGVNAGIAVFAYTDGRLARTADFCASSMIVVRAPTGSRGNDVWWDKNVPTRCWSCDEAGRLYKSDDDGQTWTTYKNFGSYPINRIATPYPGGVWVFGGRADQPATLVQYDALVNGTWNSIPIAGELGAALVGASSAISVAAAASRVANELYLLFKGGELPGGNLFWTDNVFDGNAWKQFSGLDAGLEDGRVLMPDFGPGVAYALFDDEDVWYLSTSGGDPVATQGAGVVPSDYTPTHGLWEGEFLGGISGVHLLAATHISGTGAIFKSLNGMVTLDFFRPISGISTMPTAAQPLMLAIGAPGTPAGFADILLLLPGTDVWKYGILSGAWSLLADDVPDTSAGGEGDLRAYTIGGTNYAFFVHSPDGDYEGGTPGDLMRSTDGGETWEIAIASSGPGLTDVEVYGIADFDIGPTGDIFALEVPQESTVNGTNTLNPLRVHRSQDNGDTFSVIYTDAGHGTDRATEGLQLAVSEDGNSILILCESIEGTEAEFIQGTRDTDDDTWSFEQLNTAGVPGNPNSADRLRSGASGRWLWARRGGSDGLWYSDDFGDNWTESGGSDDAGWNVGWRRPSWFQRNVAVINVSGSSKIMVTEDNGSNWSLITTLASYVVQGLDYSPSLNKIIVIGTAKSPKVIDDPFGTPVVSDLSVGLADTTPTADGNYGVGFTA